MDEHLVGALSGIFYASVKSDAVRDQVYGNAHEFERNQDPDRKGLAMVIDLDSVDGFFGGARLQMLR
jgi:hypothetical protein